jgi:hypothetical protein
MRKSRKRLTLNRQTLRRLSSTSLARVAGGDAVLVACDTIVFVGKRGGGPPFDPFALGTISVLECVPVRATLIHPTNGEETGFTGNLA